MKGLAWFQNPIDEPGAWARWWPLVRRQADSAWVRVKPFTPGVADTMRSPIDRPGLNVETVTIRRSNRSCPTRKGLVP